MPNEPGKLMPQDLGYHWDCNELRFKELQIIYDGNKHKVFKYDDLKIAKDEKACAAGFTIDDTFFK